MIPSPLHPAIVHFPIVLILLGTLVIIVSFFIDNKPLLLIAFTLLALSAISAYFAEKTGGDAYESLKSTYPHVENILDTHANSAIWTVRFAYSSATLVLLTIFMKKNRVRKTVHLLAVILSLILTYSMHNTARLGGEMVYGDLLKLSTASMSATLEPSTHTHEGPDSHSH